MTGLACCHKAVVRTSWETLQKWRRMRKNGSLCLSGNRLSVLLPSSPRPEGFSYKVNARNHNKDCVRNGEVERVSTHLLPHLWVDMLVQHGGESTPYLIPAPVERVATSTVQSTSKSTELMRDGTGIGAWYWTFSDQGWLKPTLKRVARHKIGFKWGPEYSFKSVLALWFKM